MQANSRWLRDGVSVGLVAYGAVAAFYSVFDLLAARGALFTVNLLGQAVFRGLRDASVLQFPTTLDLRAIFAYNAVHLIVSLGIGLVVMGLVEQGEREPANARVISLVIVGGFVATIAIVGLATVPIRPLLPWWSVVVANVLASAASMLWLSRQRPGVVGRILMPR